MNEAVIHTQGHTTTFSASDTNTEKSVLTAEARDCGNSSCIVIGGRDRLLRPISIFLISFTQKTPTFGGELQIKPLLSPNDSLVTDRREF